jgi:SEC-C motif-containing protein
LGLKIKTVEAGGVEDLEGTVTFEATFEAGGQRNVMNETSLFQRRDVSLKGDWLYIKQL